MKENMPVRGYFARARMFGLVLLAIALFVIAYFSYQFFTE